MATKGIELAELNRVLAMEIKNLAAGHGYIGMKLSVSVIEPPARLQLTFKPNSILVKRIKAGDTGKDSQ